MRVLETFAGIGGQSLGWHRAGAEHVGFVEAAAFPRRVLGRHWPGVPIHEDVLAFDGALYRGGVDILTGGPPCQPVSCAGRRAGTADDRWLWGAFIALAVAVAAPVVVAENPTGLLSAQGGGAFAAVLRAFEAAGYAVEWDVLAAGALGAPHRRERVFLVARRDGGRTWPGRGGQPGMFPGRPAAWPAAGRRERGTLMTCARQWPTPRPLPWEVAAGADAMPSQQAHDAEGAGPSAGTVARGGRHSDLRAHLRAALPTPTAKDAADRDYQISGGRDVATLGHAAKAAAGVESQMTRRALPTPAAQDYKDPGADRSGSPHAQPLPQVLRDRGIVGRLSPALPEWMMSLPDGWSLPDGPGLVDAPSRPYLPDLTADLALTTEREHRCSRLRALGNACAADVAEAIARTVLESLR